MCDSSKGNNSADSVYIIIFITKYYAIKFIQSYTQLLYHVQYLKQRRGHFMGYFQFIKVPQEKEDSILFMLLGRVVL